MFKISLLSLLCATISTSSVAMSEQNIKKLSNLNVRVIFIRHGFSCANVAKRAGEKLHHTYADPELSSLGVDLAKKNGAKLSNLLSKDGIAVDLLASSSMIRAIETAYYMFGGRKIYPMPFVAEKGSTKENTPLALNKQKAIIDQLNKTDCENDTSCPVRFAHYYDNNNRSKSSVKQFYSWLGSNLDNILSKNPDWEGKNKTFTIALITHHNFLSEELGIKRPPNNAAFSNVLIFNRKNGTWHFEKEKYKKYQAVDYGVSLPEKASNYAEVMRKFGLDRCHYDVRKK